MQAPPVSPPPQFRLDLRPERNRIVVVLHGELDISTTEPVEREVGELRERGFGEICLDLSRLTFFDSSGLNLLVGLERELGDRGCRLTVLPGDGVAARILRLTRLDERFARPDR